ncbi:unnamed protein product [Mycena citricolor]|uniref:Uncharacterized protein n=1 Tax=Mycena citricolor TaxID=2018698 RepID=A0AAD2HA24_9AGAR|nr:unnamed protein product [Mycena citricolor]
MTSNPSLANWVQTQMKAIYAPDPHTQADLQSVLDDSFSPDADIQVDGASMTLDDFKGSVESHRGGTANISLSSDPEEFKVVHTAGQSGADSTVSGKMTLVRTHPWLVRAAPAQTSTEITFDAQVASNPKPQIVQLVQKSVHKPVQVHLAPVRNL